MVRREDSRRFMERLRRAFGEFLTIPVVIVTAFLSLALLTYWIDVDVGPRSGWSGPWAVMARYVGDPASAAGLLTTIAGSLITVTSITFSILLLAVQQGASALTSQIIEHYLRRGSNQAYFGFFVGTSVFALVTLVLTTSDSRPVLGVTLATVFAALSLLALILLIYTTIDQVKPVTIVSRMHAATVAARRRQMSWLSRTDAEAFPGATFEIRTRRNGYLARVNLALLEQILRSRPNAHVVVEASVGDALNCDAVLARVTEADGGDEAFVEAVRRALPVEEQRDIGCDAAFGVEQISTIGWTSISTAKSNPAPARLAINALSDLLTRWGAEQARAGGPSPHIAYRDTVPELLLDGFESLVVVASESMQHQSLAALADAMAQAFSGLPSAWRDRVEEIVLTSVPALGDHLPTRRLGASLERMSAALRADGRWGAAARLDAAWAALVKTRGVLSSRGNREAAVRERSPLE